MAEPFFELLWVRLPAVNVLSGLAVVDVKLAPEPIMTATASISTASVAIDLRGDTFTAAVRRLISTTSSTGSRTRRGTTEAPAIRFDYSESFDSPGVRLSGNPP